MNGGKNKYMRFFFFLAAQHVEVLVPQLEIPAVEAQS